MTTRRQLKTLFEAVTRRYPEFEIVGPRMLVLKPVGHLIRGIIMDRTSIANLPNQDWFIGVTCDATHWLTAAMGRFQPNDFSMKYWSHPRHEDQFIELLGTEVLPLLKSVETVADLIALRHPAEILWRPAFESGMTRLMLHAAIGRFDVVDEEARNIVAEGYRRTPWWGESVYIKVIEGLWPLAQKNDRPGVAALLHEWEREFVEAHGLQHVYERQPFCFETDSRA
jgi:hypothetical protein